MWPFGKKDKTPKVKAIEITDQNFNEIITSSEEPILLDFWASNCGPCKVMTPIVDELAREYKDKSVLIGKINTEFNGNLSRHFQIRSVPTLMVLYKRQVLMRQSGMIPKPNLAEMLDNLVAKYEDGTLLPPAPPVEEVDKNNGTK